MMVSSAVAAVSVEVKASQVRQWLVVPFCSILGYGHPFVARLWDALEPIRVRVNDLPWHIVSWADCIRWMAEEGE